MASAQEYADYINKMRQLREQRDKGLMTTPQAVGQAPKPAGMEPVNSEVGTMRQMGRNIAESFSGGVKQMGKDIGGNIATSARAVGRAAVAAPGVIWEGKNANKPDTLPPYMQPPTAPAPAAAVRPTTSTPSAMMGPTDMTVSSGKIPKSFVLGANNDTIYGGALVSTPTTNSVYTPEQMRAMGEGAGQGPMQVIPKSQMQFGNTNATQNAKAAADYKAFMERTQAAKLAPMPVAQTRRERQAGLDRAANTEQVAASRAASAAENEANRANELAISQGRDKAVVSAAEQGRPLPKETDADKLKSLVQMYETAEPDIQKELWPQIKALLGGEQKPAAQTAKTAVPSTDAIAMLKKNPKLASEFDAKYGAGSSAKHIKG